MADPTPLPRLPPETVWPPAPLHIAVPPPLFVSAEGVEVTQNGDRLVVLNKPIRFAHVFLNYFLLLDLLLIQFIPWINYWLASPGIPRPILHSSIISYYHSGVWAFTTVMLLLTFALSWLFPTLLFNRGVITMIHLDEIVKVGGRVRSFKQMTFVQINRMQSKATGQYYYVVEILWDEVTHKPFWYRVAMRIGTKSSILGRFREEGNAKKIAAIVAEFAGVLVQHRTR